MDALRINEAGERMDPRFWTSIVIDPKFVRDRGPAEEIDSLAADIYDALVDTPVYVDYIWLSPSPPGPLSDIQFAMRQVAFDAISLSINVPWEVLGGALATIFLETVRDWLREGFARRKAEHQERCQELAAAINFPPRQVEIFGPRGQLIGIVYQDAHLNSPLILTDEDAIDHRARQRRVRRWS